MKNKWLLLLLLLGGMRFLTAAPVGIGSDLPDEAESVSKAPDRLDDHTRALEFYIAGLQNADPAGKVLHLLKAVRLDPQRKMPFLVLVQVLEKVPACLPAAQKQLEDIRRKYPQDIFIALQTVKVCRRAGMPPEKIIEDIQELLKVRPQREEEKYFNSLALEYVDLLLKTNRPTQNLPFKYDTLPLQQSALLYYTVSCRRDRFSLRPSPMEEKLKEIRSALRQHTFKNAAALRRHLAFLSLVKENQLALEAVRKFKARGTVPGLLLMEAASQAGDIRTLEEALKKFPALPAEFCARLRLRCYEKCGNWSKAREELDNLKSAAERLDKGFQLALKSRDIPEMKKILDIWEKNSRVSKNILALNLLTFAEISRDAAAFAKAKKYLGTSYMQNPALANAVGYVGLFAGADLSDCEMLLEFALSRDPRNAAYLDSMAWIKYHRQDYKAAAAYIQKAFRCLEVQISGAVMALHAGDIFRALGEKEKAGRYYRLAETLYNENKAENADMDPAELRQKIQKYCK